MKTRALSAAIVFVANLGQAGAASGFPELATVQPQPSVNTPTPATARRALLTRARELNAQIQVWNDTYAGRSIIPGSETERRMQKESVRLDQLTAALAADINAWLTTDIDRLDTLRRGQAEAIRRLKLEARADDFAEWEALSKEARAERRAAAADALISAGFTGAAHGLDRAPGSARVESMIATIRGAGVASPALETAIRGAAGNPASREAAQALVEELGRAREATNAVAEVHNASTPADKRAAGLQAVATVLAWGIQDPRLELLVTELDVTAAALFDNAAQRVSAARVGQLMSLTETQLSQLKTLGAQIRECVQRANREKHAVTSDELDVKVAALSAAQP